MLGGKYLDTVGKVTLDLLLASVLQSIANIDINIFGTDIHPFDGLRGWAEDLTNQAVSAYNKAITAQQTAIVAQTGATTAQSAAAAAAAAAAGAQTTATNAGSAATVAQSAAAAAAAAAGNAQITVQQVTDGIAVGAGSSTTTNNSPSTVAVNVGTIATTASNAQTTATNVGTAVQQGATGQTVTTGIPFLDGISLSVGGLYNGVNLAAAKAAQANAAYAGLIAQQQAAASGGNTATDAFNRADSPSLGSSWAQYYYGGTGTVVVKSNVAHWNRIGQGPTSCLAFYTSTTFATDYQSAHMTTSGSFSDGSTGSGAGTYEEVFVRSDGQRVTASSADTNLPNNAIMCRQNGNGQIILAKVVGGTYTVLQTYSHAAASSDTIELRAGTLSGPRIFTVLLNGSVIMSYNDSGNTTALGAGYRTAGMRWGVVNEGIGAGTTAPMDVVEFDIADIVGGAGYVGYGWQIYRAATSPIEVDNGSAYPAGTFDTANAGPNVAINNLGIGAVVAPITGWYALKLSLFEPAVSGLRQVILKGIVGGTVFDQTTITVSYYSGKNGSAFTQDTPFTGTVQVYAVAGQIIQPAIGGNYHVTTQGDAGGVNTVFSGALTGTK